MARPRVWGCAFAALALLSSVALPACSLPSQGPTGGAILPEWQFVWVPTGAGADASLSPQAAFTNAGRAAHLRAGGGTEHLPVAVGWLATGRTFGVAVVQLDPAGHFWNLVWLVLARSGQVWQAEAGDLPRPTPCGPGRPFSGPLAVFGPACTTQVVSSGGPPADTSALWTTPQGETFYAARIAAVAERPPTGTTQLLVAAAPGWVIQDVGWMGVVTVLSDGDSVIFACRSEARRCQELAAQFVSLGADPLSFQ